MRFNPKARIDESQIDNREGQGGGSGSGLGGLGGMLPIPGGGGKIGLGTVVVVVIYLAIQLFAGNNPIPGVGGGSTTAGGSRQQVNGQCRTGADANNSQDCAIDLITNSVQDYWRTALPQQANIAYQMTKTVKYTGQTASGCGTAQSAMGPFYCPNDKRVYIDQSFMEDMLQGQLGAKGGPFALGYVLAHEYGHHIEDQLGILRQMRTQQGPKSDSVRVELMADCLGGVWAKSATTTKDADGNVLITDLTQDDIARAIDAAQSVGDDRIQKDSSGRVNQESWTHGSSAERTRWFNTGLKKGTVKACDTFHTDNL
jgi:predicted metalloprotease